MRVVHPVDHPHGNTLSARQQVQPLVWRTSVWLVGRMHFLCRLFHSLYIFDICWNFTEGQRFWQLFVDVCWLEFCTRRCRGSLTTDCFITPFLLIITLVTMLFIRECVCKQTNKRGQGNQVNLIDNRKYQRKPKSRPLPVRWVLIIWHVRSVIKSFSEQKHFLNSFLLS